jgi:iron-sulfur cluster insertion protein
MEYSFTITDNAKFELVQLQDENKNNKFRIFVTYSNSDGFQYSFTFDDEINDDDLIFNCQIQEKKLAVLIDTISIQYLNGATLDFIQKTKTFVITNPNATKE